MVVVWVLTAVYYNTCGRRGQAADRAEVGSAYKLFTLGACPRVSPFPGSAYTGFRTAPIKCYHTLLHLVAYTGVMPRRHRRTINTQTELTDFTGHSLTDGREGNGGRLTIGVGGRGELFGVDYGWHSGRLD